MTSPVVVHRSLLAIAWDIPVVVSVLGREMPPQRIVERISGRPEINVATVELRMEHGVVVHLGEVTSIESWRG